jgi:SET domain-containing protein
MKDSDKLAYYKSKIQMIYCNYAPLIITEDKIKGFIVKATDKIKKNTFICEYSGLVKKFKSDENIYGNDIMSLMEDNINIYVIVPFFISNIARYISSIDKTNKSHAKIQNVMSYITIIDDFPHIILYACTDIDKDQELYYNYNEGFPDNPLYPTQGFEV